MGMAIEEARKATRHGDVPVGAIIVKDGKVVGKGRNRRHQKRNNLLHAECVAIRNACRTLSREFLDDCDLYVTLEPCPMCAGAIIQARIRTLYFGAYDFKAGCVGSVINLFSLNFCHQVEVQGGVREEECKTLLTGFFSRLRNRHGKA